jgi:3-mercaptopyruvate sulfurtransferase SseA
VLDIKPKGVENTAALLGGWNAWNAQGLPTEKAQ